MNITPAELAELLVTHSAPLRWDLAQAKATVQKEREANQRLSTNLNSAEKALSEKDAELEKLREAWDDAEKHVSELTTELNATRDAASQDRANLSKQLDAATKRAVRAETDLAGVQERNTEYRGRIKVQTNRIAELEEALAAVSGVGVEQYLSAKAEVDRLREALAAEKAAHAKTKAQTVPHAPQVGGTIDLEFGDWVQDSSGEFSPVYLNDEKLESTDVCVVRGTGHNARIIWVAGGDS